MTTATEQQQQQQQLTGFNNQQTYSHHCKIEETAKGEARITVSIYSNDIETAKTQCLRLYNDLKTELSKESLKQ